MTNPVIQSGEVSPGHLTAWVTDGIVNDAGVSLLNTYGKFIATLQTVNFNAGPVDNIIPINLPLGYTRYRIEQLIISGATASLTAATCGVFTGPGGTGVTIVNSGTSITVSATGIDTANNMQLLTLSYGQNTVALSDTTLYFRVQNTAGFLAFGNVSVCFQVMP